MSGFVQTSLSSGWRIVYALALSSILHLVLFLLPSSIGHNPLNRKAPHIQAQLQTAQTRLHHATQPKSLSSPIQQALTTESVMPPLPAAAVALPSMETGGWLDPMLAYFLAKELDAAPEILIDIPSNPVELMGRKESGRLVLELWIDEQGYVVLVLEKESDLPGAFFDSARSNFMQSRFSPGKKDGLAVKSRMLVQVNYGERPIMQETTDGSRSQR